MFFYRVGKEYDLKHYLQRETLYNKVLYPKMEGNAFAYSVEKHRHTPEMEDVIKRITNKEIKVRFTPQVVPIVRGMMAKWGKTSESFLPK